MTSLEVGAVVRVDWDSQCGEVLEISRARMALVKFPQRSHWLPVDLLRPT